MRPTSGFASPRPCQPASGCAGSHFLPARKNTATLIYHSGERSLSLFGSFSAVRARLLGRAGGSSIPNVGDNLGKYGFELVLPLPARNSPHIFSLSAYQEIHGPSPLNTSRSIATRTFTRVGANVNYTNRNWKGASLFVNLIAYPDRRNEESAFDFGDPGAPLAAVSPKAPISVQGGVFIPF